MDARVNLVTIEGTGRLCVCGHGSDLHDLMDAELIDSPQEGCDDRLRWWMSCRGAWMSGLVMDPRAVAKCTCTSFKPVLA